MPLNCPYETRYKQEYSTIRSCASSCVPVQTQLGAAFISETQSGEVKWFPEEFIETISTGCRYSAAIKTDGTLWLWGEGAFGKLGNNDTINVSSPVQTVTTGTNWVQVSVSALHSAAIKTDGTLWLWGLGSRGLLGNNSTIDRSSPVQTITTGTNWKQVSVSPCHSAAIKTDGTLWLWGGGDNGLLGNNSTIDRSSPVQTISGGTDWCQVSLGCRNSAAVKTDGTLWLWGCAADGGGLLGNNSTINRSSPVQTVTTGTNWKQVSVGACFSAVAAIKTDGTLWLWGCGLGGQLGNNSTTNRSSPVQTVTTGTNWKQVSTTRGISAAVKTDGTLWLWGEAGYGSLGNNSTIDRSSPVQTVTTGTNWKQVNTGGLGPSAVKTDGTLWLWGCGLCGSLGNNSTIDRSSPVQAVTTGTNWTCTEEKLLYSASLSSSGPRTSAAIKTDGTLWLWGCGRCGILGNNSLINQSSPVQTSLGGSNWKHVSLGCLNAAGIKTDGTLWVWGRGAVGAIGNNATGSKCTPVQTISGGTDWCQVSLGAGYSSAIKTDGTLWLWGCDNIGQLGNNDTISQSSPVQTITTGTTWCQVSAGCNHAAAIKTDGTLWLWGEGDDGRLGNNSLVDRSSPVQTISNVTTWKQVNLGNGYSAAIKTDGTLWLWGRNDQGRLGKNDTINVSSPVQTITTGTNWKQVSLGNGISAAIKTDGTLWLWGCDNIGQLGNNDTINVSSPVQTVSAITLWKELSDHMGVDNSAAISQDEVLYLWGDNSIGQLGCNPIVGDATCTDLGNILVDKDYLLEVYPNLVPNMKAPALWVWGEAGLGRLGTNATTDRSSPVQTISGGSNWKQVFSGGANANAFAIKTDGTLWAWGFGFDGALGYGNVLARSSPVQTLSNVTTWSKVSESAAIKTDGTLWLWGTASLGRLGNNQTAQPVCSPIQTISNVTTWKQLSSVSENVASIKTDGTLWMWGRNDSGQLGNNDTISQSSPVQTVTTGTNWKEVGVGSNHSAAIKIDGTLWLWGNNTVGQLGNNDTINVSSPVQTITTGTNWKQVGMGSSDLSYASHSAAIKTDGTLWLWGGATFGRLGNNDTINQSSPVQTITTGTNWKQVSVGCNHSAAIKTDGTLWLWGNGASGRLGTNNTTSQSSPVQTITSGNDWKQVNLGPESTYAIRETYDW